MCVCSCCLHPRHAVQWCSARRTVGGRRPRAITGSQNLSHSWVCFLLQVWVWNETLWASSYGGQGYVWLLSCTEVAKVYLCVLFVRLQSQGNHSKESWLLSRPPANVWGNFECTLPSMKDLDPKWAAGVHWHGRTNLPNGRHLLQRGLQGSHEPGRNQQDGTEFVFCCCADHPYRGDARVNDDEECCHFCFLPSFPSTWEVLQETRAWKEKGLFLSQSCETCSQFFFSPIRFVSSKLSPIWCTINDLWERLWGMCTSEGKKQKVLKS